MVSADTAQISGAGMEPDEPWEWLAAGWRDMLAVPGISLTYGIGFTLASLGLASTLFLLNVPHLLLPLSAGFMLMGPMLAVGLYETSRRRERQLAHNKAHGITPATIVKQVADIMEAAYPAPKGKRRRVAEDATPYAAMSPEQLMKKAAKLEKQMLRHARDLEFEEAARLRDEIQRIRQEGLGLPDLKAG